MLSGSNGKQQLNFVNMLIRAISDELARQRVQEAKDSVLSTSLPKEMDEALQQLRLKKLLISAQVGTRRVAAKNTRH